MKIINKRVFEGKSIYSFKKCIRIDVDLEGYSEIPSHKIPCFNKNLIKMIPELKEHRCGINKVGGFVIRLEEGTYLAHICEHIIIALQNKLGIEVAYGKAREIEGDLYFIIFEYKYDRVGIECAKLAVDIINALIKDEQISFESRFDFLKEILQKDSEGPSTNEILEAARRNKLPIIRLGNSGFYQIGYGKQGRIIEATIGSRTTCVGVDMACDKLLTKDLLSCQSIPVAKGAKVYNVINLLKESNYLGYPLVLKPQYGNKGKGVFLNIKDEKELIDCYNKLSNQHKDIIVEEYIEGNDYRVCVINYKVVAAAMRLPAQVEGDGRSTIRELIDKINSEPSRGIDHEKPLTMIKINDELIDVLEKQGVYLSTVLINGRKIKLRNNANLSTGGTAIDCTDKICVENLDYCIRAAKALGLDICGVDICAKDISKPLRGQGIIMEINAAPGIRMHLYPQEGEKRNIGDSILELLYSNNPKNIPVVSITGTNGKTTTTRLIEFVLRKMGYKTGMTSTEGIYINGKCIDIGDDTGYESAKAVLLNKDVEVAILESARGGLIRKGLAYEEADIGIITNITEDHIGLDEVETMEDLTFVKSVVVEAIKNDGYAVINGDDEWSKTIISRIKVRKIIFSKDRNNQLLLETIREGGIGVFLENDDIKVINNLKEYKVINIKDAPITLGGVLDFNVSNLLAATGALVGLKVDYCMIKSGFSNFRLDYKFNSGRFNIFDYNNRKIIFDYGHNIDGYRVVIDALNKMKKNKLIGVIGVPGDRQDEMIKKVTKLCYENFDYTYLKEDVDRRGRAKGEVAKIMEDTILSIHGKGNYEIILNEIDAFKEALTKKSRPGDIIIVFYEKLDPLMELLENIKDNDNKSNIATL